MTQFNNDLDFEYEEVELGNFYDFEEVELGRLFGKKGKLRKGLKRVKKGFIKLHTVPTAMIGKAIGGKKGEKWGKKLGKLAAYGAGAGIAAGAAPALLASPTATAALAGRILSRRAKGKGAFTKKPLIGKGKVLRKLGIGPKRAKRKMPPAGGEVQEGRVRIRMRDTEKEKRGVERRDDAGLKASQDMLVRGMMARISRQLMPSLKKANKYLRRADHQREATWEHNAIVGTDKFRRLVLKELARQARGGDSTCQRTVRVIMERR